MRVAPLGISRVAGAHQSKEQPAKTKAFVTPRNGYEKSTRGESRAPIARAYLP